MTLSLCLIARNEEQNLAVCLQSTADLADETIVVDTGSSDDTRELAAKLGAQVFQFGWIDDFAAARNECLRHATGDWVFCLDADERVDETNRTKLKDLFAALKDEAAAYFMIGRSLEADGSTNDEWRIRLFRRLPGLRWKYRAHEQILPALLDAGAEIRTTDIVIHHTGYQDTELCAAKIRRNLRLFEMENRGHPGDPFSLFNFGSRYHA